MFLIFLSMTVITLCLVHLLFNHNGRARQLWRIQGPKSRFIVGNALEILLSPAELFKLARKYAATYKGIYRFWCFPVGAINLYNPEDIEIILSNSKYNVKSPVYIFLRPWLRDGLILSSGLKWQQRRKILTPAFHFNILRHFLKILDESSRRMTQRLDNIEGPINIDIVPMVTEFTLQSICETAMGTRLDIETTNTGNSYKEAIYEVGKLFIERFTRIYLYSDSIFNLSTIGRKQKKYLDTIHEFSGKVIKDRKIFVESNGIELTEKFFEKKEEGEEISMRSRKNKVAMLDLLILAERDGLIDQNGIQEEVDSFMFAGHDTTASGLTYLLMLLANNKKVQDKVIAEIDEIFKDSYRSTAIEDLSKLKYLDCCIKETLRLYPPVPFISRSIDESVTLSDYNVPEGTLCHIHIYDLHRREDLFPEAEKFIPERFLPENCVGRHPYSYIPFSAGPRNCIGQKFAMNEMKIAISTILRKFELQPVTKPENIELLADIVLRNNGPVYVSFVKRNNLSNVK